MQATMIPGAVVERTRYGLEQIGRPGLPDRRGRR